MGNETKILYLARINVTEPKEVLNIGFLSHYPFLKTLFPSFLHHHCLQFLYPTNFLVRECFSLLVNCKWHVSGFAFNNVHVRDHSCASIVRCRFDDLCNLVFLKMPSRQEKEKAKR